MYGLTMSDRGDTLLGTPYNVPYQYLSYPTTDFMPALARVSGSNYIAARLYGYFQIPERGQLADGMALYTESGQLVPGWPQPVYQFDGTNYVGGSGTSFVFADLDDDLIPELIAVTNTGIDDINGLFAWRLDGTLMPGFPVSLPGAQAMDQPTVGDITGDGRPEIIFPGNIYCGTQDTAIFAYQADGSPVPLFPMNFGGGGDPLTLQPVTLDDYDGDGNVDLITSLGRSSSYLFLITLGTPYNRDAIEWPTLAFDNMRTGWYRKWAHVDRVASSLTANATTVPGDGTTPIWITAHGVRPNSQPILWPDQFVRFGRLPDDSRSGFSTFQDNGNGSWSQKLTARVEDHTTYTVSGWINEFKLNQTLSVTFLGRPRTTAISPRAFPLGSGMDSNLTGANYGPGVTLRSLEPDLTITNGVRVSETAMTARFDAPANGTPGLKFFVANAYGRDSAPVWVLAYDPNDLFLLVEKPGGGTLSWFGLSSPNYRLLKSSNPQFSSPTTQYLGPGMQTTDAVNATAFYSVVPEL